MSDANTKTKKVYNLRSRIIVHDLQHIPRKQTQDKELKNNNKKDTLGTNFSKVTRRNSRKKHNSHPSENKVSENPGPQLSARKKRQLDEVLDAEFRNQLDSPQASKTPKLEGKIKNQLILKNENDDCLTPTRKAVVDQLKKTKISQEDSEEEKRLKSLEPIIKTFETAKEMMTTTNQKWTTLLETTDENRSEELTDEISANIGKFNLILTSKFKQFSKLIEKVKNNEKHDDQYMSANDLWGLWDNIQRQIDQVAKNFEELEILRVNGWKRQEKDDVKQSKNSAATTTKIIQKPKKLVPKDGVAKKVKIEAQKQREADAKNRMAAFKKKMLEAKKNQGSSQTNSEVQFL